LLAWIVGWDLILEYCIGSAAAAVSCSAMIRNMVADSHLALAPSIFGKTVQIDFLAALLVLLTTFILVLGIRESARATNVFVWIKVGVILAFIAMGVRSVSVKNLHPFIPPNMTGEWGRFGFSGVLQGAGSLFLAYIGFDSISTAAGEAKNPQRDLPIALLVALAVCTTLYVGFALVLTGNIRYDQLGAGVPLETSYRAMFSWQIATVLSIGTAIGLLSLLIIMLYGQTRLLFAMSRDGLLPSFFSHLHHRFITPVQGTCVVGAAAAVAAALMPFNLLTSLTGVGTLFAFTAVCFSVLIIRARFPDRPRTFRLPFGSLIPGIGISVNSILMIAMGPRNWFRLGTWLALGLIVYVMYGRAHSEFRQK
jgi:basic amino acid/polyamine antiporter, APA family